MRQVANGTSRQFVATHQFGRFWGKADKPRRGCLDAKMAPIDSGPAVASSSSISRGGFRRNRLLGGHMFYRDPLAVVMAVMPRMRDPAMQGVVAYNFLRARLMAPPPLFGHRPPPLPRLAP